MYISNKKSDKAQEAISEVASNLRFEILNSIQDVWDMMQEIDNLNSCTSLEELDKKMEDLSCYDELPTLDSLLLENGYDSLEHMVEEELDRNNSL